MTKWLELMSELDNHSQSSYKYNDSFSFTENKSYLKISFERIAFIFFIFFILAIIFSFKVRSPFFPRDLCFLRNDDSTLSSSGEYSFCFGILVALLFFIFLIAFCNCSFGSWTLSPTSWAIHSALFLIFFLSKVTLFAS